MRAVKITLLALAGLLAGAVVFLVVADRLNQFRGPGNMTFESSAIPLACRT